MSDSSHIMGLLPGVGPTLSATPLAGEVCPLCRLPGTPAFEQDGVLLRECRCEGRILLAWPWASEAAYIQHYTAGGYHGERPCWERDDEWRHAGRVRVRLFRALYPDHVRVLDVGGGTGAFVAEANAAGLNAAGLEPDLQVAAAARARGRPMRPGCWQGATAGWEAICLHDVLEHLTRPLSCLRYLSSCLKRDGVLVVEMPEWGAEAGRRHVKPREHIALYDACAASALFSLAGLALDALIRPKRGALGKACYYLRPLTTSEAIAPEQEQGR